VTVIRPAGAAVPRRACRSDSERFGNRGRPTWQFGGNSPPWPRRGIYQLILFSLFDAPWLPRSGVLESIVASAYFSMRAAAGRSHDVGQGSTVGAVSHRAFFVGSAKDARWDTAPTVDRTRFARLWRGAV